MLEDPCGSGAPFVGRQQELRRIEEAWLAGERLITLLGPGGGGKTRLALEAARRHEEALVVVCRLDEARTLEDLLALVAEALGFDALGGTPAATIERIGRALTRGAPLLVLDGFERLIAHAPATVHHWLGRAPELRCLVTSRRALGLDEEQRVELGPLSDDEGVTLFVAQARRMRAGWEPEGAELPTIREIARRLDGLPLAIKLCAARASLLSPAELLVRLASRFELLHAGHDDPVTRHRSLQAALDGSWALLSERERAALAGYSVLRGSFDAAAAEAMLADGGDGLDVLQALCEHSLVRVLAASAAAPARFALYETVRDYAAERLDEAGARAAAEAVAVAHYRRLATRLAAAAAASDAATAHPEVAAELRREREHLLFAVERLLPGDPEAAVAVLLALQDDLCAQERRDRHLALLAAAILALRAGANAGARAPLLARALVARADVLRLHGELAEAEHHADEAATIAASLAPGAATSAVLVDALRLQGEVRRGRGDTEGALSCLGEALERARAGADRRREGVVRLALAAACYAARRFEAVEREASAAYAIWMALGDRAQQAAALTARGLVLFELERLADARPVLEEALAAYRAVGHRQGEGRVVILLAELASAQGRADEAAALARDALELHRAQGAHPWTEMDLGVLALIEVERGRADEALAHARQAEASMGQGEFVRIRAFVHACRGVAEAGTGAVAAAEAAFAAAHASAAGLEPALVEFVGVCEGCVEVARALQQQAAGRTGAARLELERAQARLDLVRERQGALVAASQNVRAAIRVLSAAIARAKGGGAPPPASRDARAATMVLRIDFDAHCFSPPGGGRVALDRRAWGRLLEALARQRLARPGEGLTTDQLFAAGWPGERALKHAASNRVWVALSGLRGLGLDAVIVRRRGRYLLDPAIAVELEASGAAPVTR